MNKPTKEEYENALKEYKTLSSCIGMSRKKIDGLLDTICEEKSSIKMYEEALEKHKETIIIYEAFEELEHDN